MRSISAILLVLTAFTGQAWSADITLAAGVTVAPGDSAPLAVTLANASVNGVFISLLSSDSSLVTVNPSSVYIPAGATTPFAQPRVTGVNFGQAVITANSFGLASATQVVRVAANLSGPSSQTVMRGSSVAVSFSLSSPVPSAVTLAVRSDDPGVASVPASATIPAGGMLATITVTGVGAGTTTVRAGAAPGIPEATVSITVIAPSAITLPGGVSVALEQSAAFPVMLGTPAPAGGVTVALTSSDGNTVTVSPASVFVPAGATAPSVTPQVTGLNVGLATITASAPGYATASQAVAVTATITVSPQTLSIPAGGARLLTIALSTAAPSSVPVTPDRGASGFVDGVVLQLSSSNPAVAQVQPSVHLYPDGSQITTVVVVVSGIAAGTAIIHANALPFIADQMATVVVGGGGGTPASIAAVGGTPQSAVLNTPYGLPLSALVTDTSGNPVSGVTVTFTAPAVGPGGSFAGGVTTAVTDGAGIARSAVFTANATVGSFVVAASAPGVASIAGFSLTNLTPAGSSISVPPNASIEPGQTAGFQLLLGTPAPAGGVNVTLTSSDPSRVTVSPSILAIGPGQTAPATQPSITGMNYGSATIGASAPGFTSASGIVQVGATLSFSPATLTVSGPGPRNVTLHLSSAAPVGGLNVSLSSTDAGVASVAGSASFPAGTTDVSVPLNIGGAGSAVITATAGAPNVQAASLSVTVQAGSGSGITLGAGVIVAPGESAPFPVTISSATAGGVFVTLSSSDSSIVTVSPSAVYIPAGATAPFGMPRVTGVSFGQATITAIATGFPVATQTVLTGDRLSAPPSQTVQRGSTANVPFTLSSPAPASLTLAIRSDDPGVASVPAIVTVPAGGATLLVPVTGVGAGTTTIRASAPPAIPETAVTITVVAPAMITLASGISAALEQSVLFAVTLGTPAPAGGVVVNLTSSDPHTASISPSSVFVPAGSTTPAAQVIVTGVNIGQAAITASAAGYMTATATVSVTATITLSPQTLTIASGGSQLLAIQLSAAAPSNVPITPDRGSSGFIDGLTVQLSSTNPAVAQVQPTVQFYPDGSSITTVVVVVHGISPGTAVIHANALPFIPDVTATIVVQ